MHSGELIYHFINVIIITSLIAPWVLWRYRVAVLKGMQARSGDVLAPAGVNRTEAAPALEAAPVFAYLRRARRRIALAVLAAIAVPSLILTALYLLLSDLPHSPAHVWLVASVFASAALPMIAVFLAIPFWRAAAGWLAAILACASVGLALAVLQRAFEGKPLGIDQLMIVPYFLLFVAIEWAAPLLLLLATGSRKFRGVAPITFAGLLAFGLAPLAGSRLTAWAATTVTGGAWLLSLGINAGFFLTAFPTGWLAWQRLKAVARAYEKKRLSDAQLLARTWWLMFVASLGITLANADANSDKWPVIFAAATCAYLAFAPLLSWSLSRFGAGRGRPPARTLLLLRVFGYTARTERLFDRIAARWRFCGPVTMIAAPDVIARTLDPEDFLRYLTGRVSSFFVQSRQDLESRLVAMDREPDPDGRYRINEFCCRDNTWQATVVELMDRADAVIMDLRGLTEQNRGCEFELDQLAARVDPQRIVLVVDESTDRKFVERAFLARDTGSLPELLRMSRESAREAEQIFKRLVACAYGPQPSR
jgi:hypothetical protein